MATEQRGQRGKAAEKAVEVVLKALNQRGNFAYHRLADARSARNFLAANPADFIYACNGVMGYIEVKSLASSHRLPSKNVSQLAVLHKFEHAGSRSFILVHHITENVWRIVSPVDLEFGVPSWSLLNLPTYQTPEAALLSTGYF